MTKEDIIVTGISGRYPQADSFTEFKEKLFAGVDLVTDDEARWPRGFLGVPERMGTIKDLSRFDASFFGVPPRQVQLMDPQLRILLESSYEAIMDAGYNPETLRGRNIGVFVGCGLSETMIAFGRDSVTMDGYIVTGSALYMLANRVSYALDFSGPSFTLDSASASTLQALNLALQSLRLGHCDAAIVAGTNIQLNPLTTLSEFRFGLLSVDGKSKSFNANADGFVRSESIGAIFLQPISQARRYYAKLVNAKGNTDGYKVEGITVPSSKMQERLLREVYGEYNVDPLKVTYIETHGTGTKAGDPQEMGALSRFFCVPERKRPLKIGAVKSVAGHAEAASSLCTISKMVMIMETGMIPANLHFTDPNPNIPCLHDGSTEVIVKPTPFDGGPVGVNAFGFGGTNVHAIFERNPGPHVADLPREKTELPRLVLVAGRSQQSLRNTLDRMEADGPYPDSGYALLNSVGQPSMKLFPFRGYALVPVDGSRKPVTKVVERVHPAKRPLWFIFDGLGCEWNGMAKDMMNFDVFARSIRRSHDLLAKTFGIDLMDLVTSDEPRGEESSASVLVSIVSVQVALVDVIHAVGLRPDGIVGHSLGEIASAYADGGLTAEQAVLCAYWRGRCTDVGDLPRGAMAAVGLTWEEAQQCGYEGVEAACHNSEDSVTVSGPADAITDLVKDLRAQEKFALILNSMNVAFHSTQMQRVGPSLLKEYKKVIPEPKLRGKRWVSSSLPESRWDEPIAQHCCPEYFVNNLVSPVLFCEAVRHIPRDAIVVEIAPHCLLLSILRRSLGSGASCVGLMRKETDNYSFLGSLGKLHTLGVKLDLSALYPPVPWPLPRGTPNIGHLVSWDHSQQWAVATWKDFPTLIEGKDDMISVDIRGNDDNAYLAGHRIAGEVTFPVGGHLLLAWKALSRRSGQTVEELPVIFENVKVHRKVVLPETGPVSLAVNIMHSSGEFEVSEGGTLTASGCIRTAEAGSSAIDMDLSTGSSENFTYELDAEDIYRDLTTRGYDYQGDFRGIVKSGLREPCGKLLWKDNWVTFVDSVIQYTMFKSPLRELTVPTSIEYCRFDPYIHAEVVKKAGDTGVDVNYNQATDTCRAGGVAMRGIKTTAVECDIDRTPLIEGYRFVPYIDDKKIKDNRESLTREYVDVCCSVAKRAMEKSLDEKSSVRNLLSDLCEVPEHVVNQYLKESRESHGLLRFLHSVSEQADRPDSSLLTCIQSALPAHKENLEADILSTGLFNENPLRFLMDIVVENSNPKKLRILELASRESDALLVSWLRKYLSEFSFLPTTEYAVAHPSPDSISGKVPEGIKVVRFGSTPSRKKLPEADIIVARSATWLSSRTNDLADDVSAICGENAFVLLAQRTALTPAESLIAKIAGVDLAVVAPDEVEAQFSKHGLRLVAFKSNNISALYLFRKRSVPVDETKQEIVTVNSKQSDLVESIKKSALDYEWKLKGENLWLLAEEAATSGIVGLANCLRYEPGGTHIRCVFDASSTGTNKVADFSAEIPEYKEVMENDLFMNIHCNGQWGSYRHVITKSSLAKKNTKFAVLGLRKRGDPSSLDWYESSVPHRTLSTTKDAMDAVVCDVHFAAVNTRDVMVANGQLSPEELVGTGDTVSSESPLGQEFSGTDQTGRRLMGLVSSQALATAVAADPILLWEVPDSWTLTEASTVPLAYSTAYYALLVRGNMRPGESVLVDCGSGCFGQAAIAVALSMSCTVFTSVGSSKEKQFLKDHFPELDDRHIVNYRDLCLEEYILRETKERGVDLVFHSLHGANTEVIVHCLATNGRYLFIDAVSNCSGARRQELSSKRDVLNVITILVGALHNKDPCAAEEKRRVAELLREGIASGAVKPLPATVIQRDEVKNAFKAGACEASTSKIVLQVRPETNHRVKDSTVPLAVEAIPRTYFYRHKAYIVVGEVASFALEFVNWMVTRGCRKLLLTGGHEMVTGYQRLCLHRWHTAGVSVVVSKADLSTAQGALQVIKEAEAMGAIGGIFIVSQCHEDTWVASQATEDYKADYRTKAAGTRNLDEHSRKLCPQLDHFVVFSSLYSGRGASQRSASGYVDSGLERLCERRAADGLPGIAIQWGPIDECSTSSDAQCPQTAMQGTHPQKIKSFLEAVERFLNQSHPVVSSLVKAEVTSSLEEKLEKNDLVDSVARIFGFQDSSAMNQHVSLVELGLDSIMGMQIVGLIEKYTGLALSVKGIRQFTLSSLREMSKEQQVN